MPAQIVAFDAVVVTVGAAFTVIVRVDVLVHPLALVPVTVYVVVVVGDTVTDEPVKLPGIQLYVEAPLALSVVELPAQIVVLEAVVVTVGVGLTVIVRVDVFVQPFAAVPVTVYVVEDVGDTVTDEPVKLPGIQLYVEAPLAFNVVELPAQIVVFEAVVVTVGNGLTVMVRVAVFVQPAADVPVTVYVVVVVGDTFTDAPVKLPGIQAYVDAPLPVRVVELPAQIVVFVAVVVTEGAGFTVITSVCVPVPEPFVAVCVTVYVPAVFQITPVTF